MPFTEIRATFKYNYMTSWPAAEIPARPLQSQLRVDPNAPPSRADLEELATIIVEGTMQMYRDRGFHVPPAQTSAPPAATSRQTSEAAKHKRALAFLMP